MPAVVACPKCKSRYTLPDNLMGRSVKCKSCATMFKVGGSPANQKTNPQVQAQQQALAKKKALALQAQKKELAKFGLDGPIDRQPDIFTPQPSLGQDPLANHVVHDPGFAEIDLAKPEEVDEKSTSSSYALFENPALKEVGTKKRRNAVDGGEPGTKKKKKKRKSRRERLASAGGGEEADGGFEMSGAGNVAIGFIIMAIGIGGTIYSVNNPDPEGYSTYYYGAIIGGFFQMCGGAYRMMT